MKLIGENLNVMSVKVGKALKEMDPAPIRQMAAAQAEAGVDCIDVNLGPLRKGGAEAMTWVVKTIQEVTDTPLSLDTTSVEAIEAGLRQCKGKALINSISARPERMETLMPLAKKFGAAFIALTMGVEGIPRDANERGLMAAEILAKAAVFGIPEEDIWIDPIVLPVNSQQIQVLGCTEFVMMLPDIFPQCKATGGLSNVSNGVPGPLRNIMNRTYLIMLKRYGMHSVIADAFDEELRAIADGKRPNIEDMVCRAMDGEPVDIASLSSEEAAYVKTVKVLTGRTLYSDSWLEL